MHDYLNVHGKLPTLRSYAFFMQKHKNSPEVYQICSEILESALLTTGDIGFDGEDSLSNSLPLTREAYMHVRTLGNNPSSEQLESFSKLIFDAIEEIEKVIV